MDDAKTIIPIILSVLFVIVWAGYAYNKRRSEAFLSFAIRRGLTFSKNSMIDLESSFVGFKLFSQGFEKKATNLISGETGGATVLIFDYSYKYIFKTGEEGQSPRNQSKTVLIVQSDRLNLPLFHLYPKNILNSIFSGIQQQDIDMQRNAEFTDSYVLKADNMADIKKSFSGQALSYLAMHRGWTIEGKGSSLIFHRFTLLKPDELNSFLDEGLELFRLIS